MFYSHLILTKKGTLGKVWMAATLGESKISRAYANKAKIHILCEKIEQPATPFALRLSSNLMLGVVRVFSRKSTIILSDVNSVMQALMRYRTQKDGSLVGRKRGRDTSNIAPDNHNMLLQGGQNVARFDSITLPMRKKQRTDADVHEDVPGAIIPGGSNSRSHHSSRAFRLPDTSLGDSDEIDVLTAYNTVFPAIVVPPLGEHLPSGLESQGRGKDSLAQRDMLYRAREQDITLAAPSSQLEDITLDLFGEDIQLSLHSDVLSQGDGSRAIWGRGLNGNDIVQSPAKPSGSSRNSLVGLPAFEDADGLQQNLPVEDALGMEPLELEPLNLSIGERSAQGSANNLPDEPKAEGQQKATDQAQAEEHSNGPKVKKSITSSSEDDSNFRTPIQKRELNTNPDKTATSKSSSRKRKSPHFIHDKVTELSTGEIRNQLNDTSDIVVRDIRDRKVAKKQRASEIPDFAVPEFLKSFAKELTDMFEAVTEPPFTRAQSPRGIQAPALQSDTARKRPGKGGASTRAPARDYGGSRRQRVESRVPETDANIPQLPMPEEEEPFGAPIISPDKVSPNNQGDSSVEIHRAGEPGKLRSNDQISIPSGSGGGKNSSGPTPAGSLARSVSKTVGGNVLDVITASDKQAFERACSGSHDNGSNQESQTLQDKGSDGSPFRLAAEVSTDDGSGIAKIPVSTAEFQLLEATEMESAENASSGPVSQINVRAFKILELLRRLTREKESIRESPILTFDELVGNCRRAARSRAFFNCLVLINARFINVKQDVAYGPIEISRGSHF